MKLSFYESISHIIQISCHNFSLLLFSFCFSVWSSYSKNPSLVTGVYSMFASKKTKLAHYNLNNVMTTAFANVAVIPLYHLNAYTNANPLTGNNGKNFPIQLTAEIIGGILCGKINKWNDTLIQLANPISKSYLPNQIINVVIRSGVSDTNNLMLRFLTSKSKLFNDSYNGINGGINSNGVFNFSAFIPSSRLYNAVSNERVDSLVTTFDGTFGYYLQYTLPGSTVANYCLDPTCSTGAINPTSVTSISACATSDTVINPSSNLYTYDLMLSSAIGCYPIVGTVDYSLLAITDSTCARTNSTYNDVLTNRIKFSSWLFHSPVVVQPLAGNSIGATSDFVRALTYKKICDIKCNDNAYGYQYCNYRDCSWNSGDYNQDVSQCNAVTMKRTVTYSLKLGTKATCIQNPSTEPPNKILVDCTDVLSNYSFGRVATALSIIGMVVCAAVIFFVVLNRSEKIIKKSQPVFIYIFIIGAFFMNLSILAFVGPNDNNSCLLRPWSFNIASTLMFAPLLMKLHRIDMLFRLSKKLKKAKIPDYVVRQYFV